jgi:DNA-binding transcriptional ArsR family regulator
MSDPGRIFDVLGDPTRRRVIAELSALGSASSTELARCLPITRQAVSKHLDALAAVGLVSWQRDGRAVLYRLEAEPFNEAVRWMSEVGAQWETRLSALRERAARRKG